MDIVAKTKDDYNKIAEFFAKTRSDERELAQFSALLKPGQNVLDWGCGNGRLTKLLRNRHVRYTGVDQSEEMIRLAQQECASECAEGWVNFQVIPGLPPWPLEERKFDGIFAIASLHHLPSKLQRYAVFKEMMRVLKDDGYVVITTWNLMSDWAEENRSKGLWQAAEEPGAFWIPWRSPDGTVLAERYYCHLEPHDIEETVERVGMQLTACYWSSDSKESDRKTGKNLVCIARKK